MKFGSKCTTFYVLLDNEGYPLNKSQVYNEDITPYIEFYRKDWKYVKFEF